jgi:hypothetical protein
MLGMKLNEKNGLMSNKQHNHKEVVMKKSLATIWAMAAVVGMLVSGCNKSTNGPEDDGNAPAGVTDEQSAMKYEAENDEFVKNDEIMFSDQAITATDYAYVAGQVQASVTPLRWGRFISGVTRTSQIDTLSDTTAVVHVHKVITGTLKIKALRGVDTVLIEKPFSDNSDRNVLLKRVNRNPKKFWNNWKPVATSLVDGGTPNGQIDIKEIQIVKRNGDTLTIGNPLRFYLRYRWMGFRNGNADVAEFNGGDSVKVKVTLESASPDTDLVALRFGFNSLYKNRAKMNLVRQTIGGTLGFVKVFERTFYVHPRPGQYHVAIDAATKATLYDDSPSAYSVSWWGIPYRVF